MPSTSKKQHNFMEAVANNPSFAKKAGVPQSVGQDFAAADKAKAAPKGTRPDLQGVNKPKTDHGDMNLFKRGGTVATKKMNPFAGKESGKEESAEKKLPPWMYKKGEKAEGEGKACGGKVVKKAKGGSIDGCATKGKTRGKIC